MEKCANFDILVNSCFMDFNSFKDEIVPDNNDWLLSIVNGYEDNQWRYEQFKKFVFDNVALTALSKEERDKLAYSSYSELVESAKHLRLLDADKDEKGRGSEIAEIVLYGIMKHHYGAISVVPKIFYKQNDQDNAKGADSVHIVLCENGDFSLWLGEAKFYNSIENVRLDGPLISINQMLKTPIIKKEISIITNIRDLELEIHNMEQRTAITELLSNDITIDKIKSRLHVPILLLHECALTANSKSLSEEYIKQITDYHKERATEFFKKQISRLGDVPNYDKINFHLILFPVPKKSDIVEWFVKRVKDLKEDALI